MAVKPTRSMSERTFQNHVVDGFEKQDYTYVPQSQMDQNFNRETAIDEQTLIEFLIETQPKEVAKVERQYGVRWSQAVIKRIGQVIADKGLLWTLRNQVEMAPGAKFKILYFKPRNDLNQTAVEHYRANRFQVTDEFHYGTMKDDLNNRIDVVLLVNGFPLVTIELKNHQTGQTVNNAIRQYMTDRNPKEQVFQPDLRSLVHFAVDADDVYMATELKGKSTKFVPSNQGNGKDGGGNPPAAPGKFGTSYLWEEVLTPDSLLDIIERFVQITYREKDEHGKKITRQARSTMKAVIFPRYHQLRVVRRLLKATREQGPGHNYLIQHSAGSGKSYSIAWLAYHLASLTQDSGDSFFNSVIVLVDRVILDEQLQGTIMKMPHPRGMVAIAKDSAGLRDAVNAGARIIISTIQKFPYIYTQTDTAGRTFAIIIDEAHSSQSGEAHRKTKQALGDHSGFNADEFADVSDNDALDWDDSGLDEDTDDAALRVRNELNAQGVQPNLSFYAFTATPKPSTLETFGTVNPDTGKPEPFDLYSMKQAIEEGFILDVLTNYTTFKTYFQLVKKSDEDPKRKASRTKQEIMNFVKLDPSNVSKISEIIVDHFHDHVMPLLHGDGKGMVVTSSRKAAAEYFRYMQKLAAKTEYAGVKPVVAFSGKLDLGGEDVTEETLNGFPPSEIAERFNTSQFNLMIVANKFQTGFDQPKLCAMYVDKKLTGVAAVQTLSRLNRTCAGKQTPIVLDFANDAATIQAAFEPYYTQTDLDRVTDPNVIYDMKTALDAFQIYDEEEVAALCRVWLGKPDESTMPEVLRLLGPAKDRYADLDEDGQEEFRKRVGKFLHTYTYVTQMIRLDDQPLFKLDTYLTFLNREIAPEYEPEESIDGLIAVTQLRIENKGQADISLTGGEPVKNNAGTVGVGKGGDDEDYLSSIIDQLNQLFGTDFSDPARKFFEGLMTLLQGDGKLSQQARNNSRADFRTPFDSAFLTALFKSQSENADLFRRLSSSQEAMQIVQESLFNEFYNTAHRGKE
ncbi:type I restriction endonuclease subunit R [Bifidobacterium biavatii]|uniref:Helicase, type I site-specific restriction-modification system restriction subunit n=1 Tax=Bifidobacterium biavatii DSM 23969 TaxID=1437608 RepID=A0A087A0C5_9BIFI|nr:type I restriction endonuclease [Bifidobacterium biavatii]KFI52225.1 helicase, type I site-specific restriction-modification system restriction subunit [Bifidobacterium biavatii DSM 23969]